MQDKCFLDTNILLYIVSNDDKKFIAKDLIKSRHTISIQVLNEFSNVSVRKLKLKIYYLEQTHHQLLVLVISCAT